MSDHLYLRRGSQLIIRHMLDRVILGTTYMYKTDLLYTFPSDPQTLTLVESQFKMASSAHMSVTAVLSEEAHRTWVRLGSLHWAFCNSQSLPVKNNN